ncbi:MAG: hypothetical protein IIT43_01080, partial [Clostridia bacterium]|nr:hypothetical protein [Clostridia bacterium]
ESPDCDACLLDYYAILPELRDAGLGGRSLQRLAELVRDRGKYIRSRPRTSTLRRTMGRSPSGPGGTRSTPATDA